MRIALLRAAEYLLIIMLAHALCSWPLELRFVVTAHAQSIPKSLEQGGTDNAMRASPERLDGWHRRWAAVRNLHDFRQRAGTSA